MEGLARWADLTLFPRTAFAVALKALTEYYGSPQKSLFARSYDAVGFWAHLQDTTGKLWERIPAIVRGDVGGDDARTVQYALAPGHETEVLQSWGSSAFDLSSTATPDWRMDSPLDGRYRPSAHAPSAVDSSSTFTLKPWSTTQLSIGPSSSGPLIEMHLDQAVHARFGVSENYVDSEITSRFFLAAGNRAEGLRRGAVPPIAAISATPDLDSAGGIAAARSPLDAGEQRLLRTGKAEAGPPTRPDLLQKSAARLRPGGGRRIQGRPRTVRKRAAADRKHR